MRQAWLVSLIGSLVLGFGIPESSAAQDGKSVWVVRSSITERSIEIGRFAGIECDEFQLGDFTVAGKRIVGEGVHPVIGKIELSGTLGNDGTIKSMGNRRASIWIRGRIREDSASGRWGETNFGCEGDWSAERAK